MTEATQLALHEQFLLLLFDDVKGAPLVSGYKAHAGVAGACVMELVLQGALRLEGQGRKAKLVDTQQGCDGTLAAALERAAGRSPKSAVDRIGGTSDWKGRVATIRHLVFTRLSERGLGTYSEHKALGLFPQQRWVGSDRGLALKLELRALMTEALGLEGMPDNRMASLISLCSATEILPKVLPELDRKFLKRRGKEILEGEWAARAVAEVIREIAAAAAAGAVAATGASTSG